LNQNNKNYQKQLSKAQAEIAEYKKEIAHLQKSLDERTQDVNKLIQWMQSLQQDILAVYDSATWQMGNLMTRLILKLLRRPVGITARSHINKILNGFDVWKINYFQNRRQQGLQSYTPWHDTKEYALWFKQYDTLSHIEKQKMQEYMVQWQYRPVVSILMLASQKTSLCSIESLHHQIYPHWELCLVHQGTLPETIVEYAHSDHRIKLVNSLENNSLAYFLNSALAIASGDFIALMGAEDQLPTHALYKVAEILNTHPDIDLIYTDEDKLDAEGRRYDPYFKSDWNPDLFYSQHFIRHLAVYRRTIIDNIGGFRADYPDSEDYDLALRFIEKIDTERIQHIPQILYHKKIPPTPPFSKRGTNTSCQVLQAHFLRKNQSAVKVVETIGGHTRVIYPLPTNPPLVSLIIPTRDKLKLLRGTVEGILHQTDYKNIEIIIMDNGSEKADTLYYFQQIQQDEGVTVIRHAAPFNYSQLNNIGVSHAKGKIIGLINNDLEIISSEWLTEMVSHALRPEIGAVGAKLYYANDTIQHAGVIVGLAGMAGHGFKFLLKESSGYYWKPFLTQNYSAVTAACLIMRRQIFKEVGGLNEKHLKVAFNDVDLCLRIRERGYRIVWTPYAELYHLESASRGSDNTLKKYLRLRHELNYMKSRWGDTLLNDPYYNPNLTIEYEDFSLAFPPRSLSDLFT
jgi:GT2 family glycosyltransferase